MYSNYTLICLIKIASLTLSFVLDLHVSAGNVSYRSTVLTQRSGDLCYVLDRYTKASHLIFTAGETRVL